jgi:hypothetical protein
MECSHCSTGVFLLEEQFRGDRFRGDRFRNSDFFLIVLIFDFTK